MSVHALTEASQKDTCPTVNGVGPALAVAVNVTTAPEATLVTGVIPEVIESVVAEPVFDCAPAVFQFPQSNRQCTRQRKTIFREPRDAKFGGAKKIEVPANQGTMLMAMPPNRGRLAQQTIRVRSWNEGTPRTTDSQVTWTN